MNIEVRDRKPVARVPVKQMVADCDIHPRIKGEKELFPYLEKRWQDHSRPSASCRARAFVGGRAYPKGRAERVAPRRLAAERRPAGQRPAVPASSNCSTATTSHSAC